MYMQHQILLLNSVVVQFCSANLEVRLFRIKVSKGAKTRNRYNQVHCNTPNPGYHMGKWQSYSKTQQTRAKRSALSQQVTTKHK